MKVMSNSVSNIIVLLDIQINKVLYSIAISSTRLYNKHNYQWNDMDCYQDNSFSLILREDYQHSNMKGDWEMVKGVYKDTVGEVVVDDDDLTIKDIPIERVVLLKGDVVTTKDEVDNTFSKDQAIGIPDQDMNKDELTGVSDEGKSDNSPESDKEEASDVANEMDIINEVSIENDVVVHKEIPDETVNEASSQVVIEDHKEDLEAIPKDGFDETTIESHSEDGSEAPNEDDIIVHSEDTSENATESPIESLSEHISEQHSDDGSESLSEHISEQHSDYVNHVEMEFSLSSDISSEMSDGLSNQLSTCFDSNSDSHAEVDSALGSSKTLSVNDNLSMIPQASLHSVCGESVITCDTGYNDIDSIPAVAYDYSGFSSGMTVSDVDVEDPITSEPPHIVDSNSKPFRLISANALLESESDDDELSPTTNSLSIEDSSDEELKQYLIKNSPKPYRCHRSRSPPRNNPPRMNSPIKEPDKPERLIPHQLLNGHSKPKPIARPVVQNSSVGCHDTVPDTKPVTFITPMPSSSFTTPSETKHSFQFAEDLYSRLNMKLSMIGQSINNDPVESSSSSLSSTSSTSSVSSTSSFVLSSSSSVLDESPKPVSGVRRTTVSHYEPLLENVSLVASLTLSDYIPSKKATSPKTVTKKVTPETTPIKEDSDDDQNLILSEEEQLLLHNPEKKLELMVYSN